MTGRTVTTPLGRTVQAIRYKGEYQITVDGVTTVGWLGRTYHYNRKTWGWAINHGDPFEGHYVDMGHAVDGLFWALDQRK